MVFVVVLCLLLEALWIEALCRLALAAILWLPIIFCAVAATQWTASLHLADPLAPLYAFFAGGVAARIAFGYVVRRLHCRHLKCNERTHTDLQLRVFDPVPRAVA